MSDEWVSQCDWQARMFVNGGVQNDKTNKFEPQSGAWSVHFRGHPLVQRAEREGWGRDLRMHCVAEARRLIMANQEYRDVDRLMPTDKRWIEYASVQGARSKEAAKFRESLPPNYWGRKNTRDAVAPNDDSQDRRRPMSAGEAVTRAAQAGFPDYSEDHR